MSSLTQRLTDLITPTADAEGFEIVRLRVTGSKTKTLQVMAERPDGAMTAEDCAALSRALSPVLDAADPIEGEYVLEVSSPGIDRPLTRLKDFDAWAGHRAKIELDRLVEGRKRFAGVLSGLDGENICLDMDDEDETALIPFEWVATAKLELTDDLIRESLKAAKAAAKDAGTGNAEATDAVEDRTEAQ
ncbi:MAG: ribosome maturation factor RimP [Pseudomonadota bacterium]